FHEALNLAAIQRLPVVFICENNLWALSAAFNATTSGQSVAQRATAYQMPGERIDGNDVEAVFAAVGQAAAHARRGLGPSLLECVTYRWEGHSIFTRIEIRPCEEIEEWKQKDPIERYRSRLLKLKTASVESLRQIDSEVAAEVAHAAEFARLSLAPDAETALEDIYS